ncbi:MAG: hypothetical protein ACI4V4_00895 [Eubacterium sp.]
MQKSLREHSSLIMGALILFAVLGLFICLPISAQAATGTLGTETPYIYCTYENAEGKSVDGNSLEAGTYKVTFNIKDMTSASVLQVTASYAETVTVDDSTVVQLSDTDTNFSSMGYLASDGNIVFGFVSNADDTSALTTEGTALFSIDMTFAEACDAADVITIASDPNLTFALADYGDGYDDEYAIDIDEATDYSGERYQMLSDVSPSMGRTVSGTIVLAQDVTGACDKAILAYGSYTIDVYSDSERTTLVKSVQSTCADGTNTFVIDGLSDGTYYATVTGEYSIDLENITIIVNGADIIDVVIPIVACDMNNDGTVSTEDAKVVYKASASGDLKEYCDFNGDSIASAEDVKVVLKFAAGSNLPALTIQ